MRLFIGLLIITGLTLTIACNKSTSGNGSKELTGKWKLKEFYNNPGDGSGGFEAPSGTVYATFNSDGTLVMDDARFQAFNKYYVVDNKSLMLVGTGSDSLKVGYEVNGNRLTIAPPCDEGCTYRYTRVN